MPTWFNTLDAKLPDLGHIRYMQHLAEITGYEYFVWNDRIYGRYLDGFAYTGYQKRGEEIIKAE